MNCCKSPEIEENGLRDMNGKMDVTDNFNKRRTCTDLYCLIIMAVFLVTVVVLVGYCALHTNIFRVINGYDNCANVCGRITPKHKNPKFSCVGADLRSKPMLLIEGTGRAVLNPVHSKRECVSSCNDRNGFIQLLNRCVPSIAPVSVPTGQGDPYPPRKTYSSFSTPGIADFLEEVSKDLEFCWKEIVYMSLIALGFSIVILLLFRFVIGFVIWFVLVGVVIASIGATIFTWYLWKKSKDELKINYGDIRPSEVQEASATSFLVLAIAATIITLAIVLIIFVMRKRINLLIQLFKEAAKAINSMPLLLFQPVLSFWVLAITIGTWVLFTLVIQGSGYVQEKSPENLYYKKNFAMKFARWYNLFALYWFVQFVIGCQHMVIGGAVAKWFFTRNKDELGSPIIKSFSTLFNFHLGSVAFGSFFLALIQMIRTILSFIEERCKRSENQVLRFCARTARCCLSCFENVLKYFTRNAYIEIAIHGVNFCTAGQKAFRVITSNILRVATINSIGDFVLFLGKLLVVISTVLIGIVLLKDKPGVMHIWVPLTLAGIFAFIVSHCFITVYEMVIDTIFVCFCEDYEMNNGEDRPYYMSKGLMEFVQNSKKSIDTNK